MQEEKITRSAYFITFTYDNNNCPISRNGFMELRKKHVQDLLKRVREHHTRAKGYADIRYFAVGEYGGNFRRPHYHMLLFNSELKLIIGEKHARMVERKVLALDGETPFISPLWQFGHITIGAVSDASVGYTCKYMLKDWKPMHRNDDRQPQFRLMSKGLGLNYLTPAMIQWHKADLVNRLYCNVGEGKKCSMPRYYKQKLFAAIYEDEIEALRARKDIGITVRFKMLKELGKKARANKNHSWEKLQADIASFQRLEYNIRKRENS